MPPIRAKRTSRDIPIEQVNGGILTIDSNHAQIHSNNAFSLSGEITVLAGAVGALQLYVPGRDKASTVVNMLNADADLTYTAVGTGPRGNEISVTHVDPLAVSQALAITVVGNDITVSLATGGAGAISSTAAQIKAAVNVHAAASLLVVCEDENAGVGIVQAKPRVNLAGGTDPTYVHFQALSFQANGGPASVSFLEDYWLNAATEVLATAIPAQNHLRISPNASALTIKGNAAGVLETGAGALAGATLAVMPVYGSVVGATRVSANAGQSEEWVLRPGKKYIVAMSNAHTGTLKFGYHLFWYEETGA